MLDWIFEQVQAGTTRNELRQARNAPSYAVVKSAKLLYNRTLVVAASNRDYGNHIGSPGKGYNVITVGGSDDKGNSNWSDDTMWSNSSWKNPKRKEFELQLHGILTLRLQTPAIIEIL